MRRRKGCGEGWNIVTCACAIGCVITADNGDPLFRLAESHPVSWMRGRGMPVLATVPRSEGRAVRYPLGAEPVVDGFCFRILYSCYE